MGCGNTKLAAPISETQHRPGRERGTTQWWYSQDKERRGPISRQALDALGLPSNTLVWTEGMPEWQHLDGSAISRDTAPIKTYSWAYVPFIHSVLESGEQTGRAAELAALDAEWLVLVGDHRACLATLAPAVLEPGCVERTNGLATAGKWPYIPAAPTGDEPLDPFTQAWPLLSRGAQGDYYSQEGLLSQSPLLFARLQEMVRRLEPLWPWR